VIAMAKTKPERHKESLEDFLEAEGIRDEVYGEAIKRVLAWKLEETRKQRKLSKTCLARDLGTSRSQLDRILHPDNLSVSIDTLQRVAHYLVKRVVIDLVDA
jgi:DNA-binding Xre family transcriptional regulator